MSDEQLALDEMGGESDTKTVDFKSVRIGPRKLNLPLDWKVQELNPESGVTNRITDGSHHSPNQSKDGDHYYATVSDLSSGGVDYQSCGLIDSDEYEKMVEGGCKPKKGEVLFSKDGTVGITTVFDDDEDVVLLSSIAMIDPISNHLNAKYLSQFLSSWFTDFQIQSLKSGTAIRRIVLVDIGKISIVIPSLDEQRKVASILYNVDQAIQLTRQIVDKSKRVRDGLRQKAFESGINQQGEFRDISSNEKQETRIGTIPRDWDFLPLDEACSDVVDCLNTTPKYSEDGIRVVLTSEIKDGRYNPEEAPFVSEEVYQERIRRIEPKPGDVIFTREAPIGEAFKIPEGERLCLGQRTMQFRPKEGRLDSGYLLELLYSEKMQSWYQRVAVGSTTKHMRVGDLEKMKVPVPGVDEQRRIASILRTYRDHIERNLDYIGQLERLKQGLMKDLLSGTVRTTDTNIEVPEEITQYG